MNTPNRLGIRQTQTQRLALNTRIVASLGVLRADAAGLTRYLEEQAAQNPHLRLEPAPQPLAGEWLPRWGIVLGAGGGGGSGGGGSGGSGGEGGGSGGSGGEGGGDAARNAPGAGPSLMAHVADRIDALFPRGRAREVAFGLAEALEPSGWLGRPLAELAAEIPCTMAELAPVLAQLQQIGPAGLFARNLAECLQLQLIEAGQMDAVFALMLGNLEMLARGDLDRLARLAAQDHPEILRRFRMIRALNPKPGTLFDGFASETLREPDLLVQGHAGAWQVALNRSALPSLQITKSPDGTPEGLAQARALRRMVEARNTTLLRVAREVMNHQQAALSQGPGALLPLTMAEIAAAMGLAESTVSRVVAGASIDTPLGTWWLRQLFVGRVAAVSAQGPVLSSAGMRQAIGRMIAQEQPGAPLSDDAIAVGLAALGMRVARRTVAKYRGLLGIAPAHRRKRRGVHLHQP